MVEIEELIGKTMDSVENIDNEQLVFKTNDGREFVFYHEQDCCESVSIEDVCGDLSDLVGSPILIAEEVAQDKPDGWKPEEYTESYTWTFYKFSTIKGSVTIRWYGESNGYYSEGVYFRERK
jgi:hypothetical protein